MKQLARTLQILCLLILISCKDGQDDPVPVPPEVDKVCVLQQNESVTTPGTRTIFTYDASGRLLKREALVGDTLSRYSLFEYNSQGLISHELNYTHEGTLDTDYAYEYDARGLLTQMTYISHKYGKIQEEFSFRYEYASPVQLSKINYFNEDDKLTGYDTFGYESGLMRRITQFNVTGAELATITLEYDDKKRAGSGTPALRKIDWPMIGFPFQHNITKYTVALADGQVFTSSSTYEYNDAGYPIKTTGIQMDGKQVISTHTYLCK